MSTQVEKVFIVNPDPAYVRMYEDRGWLVVKRGIQHANLVQFTGGHDVSPGLYGEDVHPRTKHNPRRDQIEKLIFNNCIKAGIPMAGICRGGQFLNVMCGGSMWQHVNNHAGVRHQVHDYTTGESFTATSTHHQMMRPHVNGIVVAGVKISTFKERVTKDGTVFRLVEDDADDVEVVVYPNRGVFCFQPHPEFEGQDELADRYIEYVLSYLGSRIIRKAKKGAA